MKRILKEPKPKSDTDFVFNTEFKTKKKPMQETTDN